MLSYNDLGSETIDNASLQNAKHGIAKSFVNPYLKFSVAGQVPVSQCNEICFMLFTECICNLEPKNTRQYAQVFRRIKIPNIGLFRRS